MRDWQIGKLTHNVLGFLVGWFWKPSAHEGTRAEWAGVAGTTQGLTNH